MGHNFLLVTKSFQILLLYFSIANLLDLAYGDPPYRLCSNKSNYTDNSPFQNNLETLMASLSSNASVSKIFNTSTGIDPDRVYAQYMCLNYVKNESCRTCVAAASQDIRQLCPGDKEAVVWGELCQLRYSNQRFLGHLDVSGNIPQQNPKNISNPEHLSLVVNKTLSSLIKKAAFGPSANMYATGDEPFTGSDSVFSLVQCSTDLSPNDCYTCLEVAIKNVTTCCYFSRGARIFSRSCYLRQQKRNMDNYHQYCGINTFGGSNFRLLLLPSCDEIQNAKMQGYASYEIHQHVLFGFLDPGKRAQLTWRSRIHIINGIAKGTLYLHEDSRLRIIHRDLKASNILLDNNMNPKISDFGMARIMEANEGEANTVRIVGTYGYMAPEYAMEGLYSTKSDVFSFGVILLEIITGRKNSGFHKSKRAPSLLAYAWELWNNGKELEMIDPVLADSCCSDEFSRCVHIGLLCVQEDASERPAMSSVVLMLKSDNSIDLPQPQRPAIFAGRFTDHHEAKANDCSVNGLTVSDILPR
ncbi:hypothetical protein POTOM_014937 [Populus tomentosa]|uniref:Cysteine-rich receptor-like protein kinase 10 n=1 Tax=Populus tomentosa TaxID=118781 RepID=A0A8X8D539_POPTO|nr:hypothetical protein POTOM_014937 [Populus tomentosa]